MWSAVFPWASVSFSSEKNTLASFTVSLQRSVIDCPVIRTARASARSRVPPHSGQVAYPRYLLKNTRTCSLYFFRSSQAKNPFTPSKSFSGSPSRISRRCSAVSCRHATFVGTPRPLAHFFASCSNTRYFGLVQGSIAPSSKDLLGSGTTRFKSKSIVLPNPWHRGHAPYGLLNENSRVSGSWYSLPSFFHSNRSLHVNLSTTLPPPLATHSRM